jgi:hypothetical protein
VLHPRALLVRLAVLAASIAACDGTTAPAGPAAPPPVEVPPTPDAGEAPVAAFACSLGTTMADIERKLFRSAKCAVCHGRLTTVPTSLDLVSDGLAARVVDRPAEGNPAKGRCAGRMLLARDDPTGGLFVEKVERRPPTCGVAMPDGLPRLTPDEISCVKLWATLAAAR